MMEIGESDIPEGVTSDDAMVLPDDVEVSEAAVGGLLGGSLITKLSLKGGSHCPPKGYRYRKLGLKGGSKDEDNIKSPTTTAEADSTQSVNGLPKPKENVPEAEEAEEEEGEDEVAGEEESEGKLFSGDLILIPVNFSFMPVCLKGNFLNQFFL